MTTFPRPTDPVSALTRADGTTKAHSDDHGRIIDGAINAKHWLKGDGTTESVSDLAAFQAVIDVTSDIYFPAGTYVLPDGSSISLPGSHQRYFGAAKAHALGGSTISVKNAYGMAAPLTGSATNVTIENLTFLLRAGSTSGGGIRMNSNNFHAGCIIRNVVVEGSGDGLSTDPAMHLGGWIGSLVENFGISSVGGHGLHLDSSGFVCNQYTVRGGSLNVCSIADRTHAGIFVGVGGGKGLFQDNNMETNRGYALHVNAASSGHHTIQSNWFEDNWNTNIWLENANNCSILGNYFAEPHNPQQVGFRHILLTSSAAGTAGVMNKIIGNQFFGPFNEPAAGINVNIEIQANVDWTTCISNPGVNLDQTPGATPGPIDSGLDTMWFNPTILQIPGKTRSFKVKTNRAAAASGGSVSSAENQFSVEDLAGTNWFMVGTRGYPIFRTGATLTSSDELATNSFAFFWDEAAGKIKARVRNNAGAYSTLDVTP